jgi:hypothetical protein
MPGLPRCSPSRPGESCLFPRAVSYIPDSTDSVFPYLAVKPSVKRFGRGLLHDAASRRDRCTPSFVDANASGEEILEAFGIAVKEAL